MVRRERGIKERERRGGERVVRRERVRGGREKEIQSLCEIRMTRIWN